MTYGVSFNVAHFIAIYCTSVVCWPPLGEKGMQCSATRLIPTLLRLTVLSLLSYSQSFAVNISSSFLGSISTVLASSLALIQSEAIKIFFLSILIFHLPFELSLLC